MAAMLKNIATSQWLFNP